MSYVESMRELQYVFMFCCLLSSCAKCFKQLVNRLSLLVSISDNFINLAEGVRRSEDVKHFFLRVIYVITFSDNDLILNGNNLDSVMYVITAICCRYILRQRQSI